MDCFLIVNRETRPVCVCVYVSGENEEFTGTRIGYSRQKKNPTLSECIAPCLVQTNKPKDDHAMQIVAKIMIVPSRFGSSISFWYAFYLDIHVQ